MLAHLAHKFRRGYVFHDYRWSIDQFPWPGDILSDTERKDLPRTPLSAFISGPAVGGSWDDSDAPRAISQGWWNTACPPDERTRIEAEGLGEDAGVDWGRAESGGAGILSPAWEKALNGSQRCIEVFPMPKEKDRQSQGFTMGSESSADSVLSTWEEFRHSPVALYTTASKLVLSAVEKNKVIFQARRGRLGWTTPTADSDSNPFDRMLAVHVQRGNSFKKDCMDAAEKNLSFYGWNQLPYLPYRFQHPIGPEWRRGSPENIALFIEHCYPDDDLVYRKIRQAKLEHEATAGPKQPRTLDVLFLATNEKPDWQKAMKRILLQAGWGTVVTTRDLQLVSEQIEVGVAVEMELAQRAAVFLGSGVRKAARTASMEPLTHLLVVAVYKQHYTSPFGGRSRAGNL